MTALILLYIIGALHQAQHTLEMVLSESDDLPEDENEPAINEYADIANGDIVELCFFVFMYELQSMMEFTKI